MKMAVHNGVFHADEVFCVAVMQSIEEDVQVVRTRKQEIIDTCDIVADVGEGKYDHHQVDKVLREDGIPYCAFGLLWQDFGLAYVSKQFPEMIDPVQKQEIVDKVAVDFITQFDASDNGITLNTYETPVTTLSQVISSFMPFRGSMEEADAAFLEAAAFAKQFLYKIVRKYVEFYTNYNYVKMQLELQNIEETAILVLEEQVGWKEALLLLDEEEKVQFVVFEDSTGSWRVQTVPKELKGFEARVDLPKAWGGLRSDELSELTGIEGCIFCHPNVFICGNQTKAGALAMAQLAVVK